MKNKDVLIRWKTKGCLIIDGVGYSRKPKDQDIMSMSNAKPLLVCKMIEIVGDADSIPVVETVVLKEVNEN